MTPIPMQDRHWKDEDTLHFDSRHHPKRHLTSLFFSQKPMVHAIESPEKEFTISSRHIPLVASLHMTKVLTLPSVLPSKHLTRKHRVVIYTDLIPFQNNILRSSTVKEEYQSLYWTKSIDSPKAFSYQAFPGSATLFSYLIVFIAGYLTAFTHKMV